MNWIGMKIKARRIARKIYNDPDNPVCEMIVRAMHLDLDQFESWAKGRDPKPTLAELGHPDTTMGLNMVFILVKRMKSEILMEFNKKFRA